MKAWLKKTDTGEEFTLEPVSMVGRSAECLVALPDPRVSRRHAMIRLQEGGYYLFDLGSFNGSYINGSRVTAGRQLHGGDLLSFAEHEFVFEQSGAEAAQDIGELGGSTIALIRSNPVVILVSDIIGFSALSEELDPDELAQIIGGWYSDCERIFSEEGGTVDKFLGDCVLGYWTKVEEGSLKAALRAARSLFESSDRIAGERPDIFAEAGRGFGVGVALHAGKVAYGGMSQGEFTLIGDAVNLAFRLEAMTRELGQQLLLSGDFLRELPEARPYCKSLGVHRVKGRAQGVEVFGVESFPETL